MHNLTQEEYQKLLLEHSDFHHKLDDLESRLEKCETQQEAMNALTRSVDRLTLTVGNMVEQQKELKDDVKALKEAPAKKFDYYKKTIIACVLTTAVGGVVGAIITFVVNGGMV